MTPSSRRARTVARALALALILPASGCSFVALGPPREPASPGEPVQCTSSVVAPLLDTAAATGVGLASLAYAALASSLCAWANQGQETGSCPMEREAVAGLLVAGTYAVAAGYGYHQAANCRNAKRARLLQCDPATGMGCGPLGLPSGTGPAPARGSPSP